MATTAKLISKLSLGQQLFLPQVQGRNKQSSILIRCKTFVYNNLKSSVVRSGVAFKLKPLSHHVMGSIGQVKKQSSSYF